MLRIIYLKIHEHPQLGNIELDFYDKTDDNNIRSPYTSIIIGPNGTGKSFILREIAEIFRQFQDYAIGGRRPAISYSFSLRYSINEEFFEIHSTRLKWQMKSNGNERIERSFRYFKNSPENLNYYMQAPIFEAHTEYDIQISDVKFPARILAVSLLHYDRFTFKESRPDEFYQYLGLRSGSGSTSTKAAQRKVIRNLFSAATSNRDFIDNLKSLLGFLNFKNTFKVQYVTRYNTLFFSGNLTVENFEKFYELWWDESFKFSNRKQDNPPWSKPYYDRNFKGERQKIDKFVSYLNEISTQPNKLKKRANSSSKIFIIDFLHDSSSHEELEFIKHLESLDIVSLDGIKVSKLDKEFLTSEISSGESSLLLSTVNIFSRVTRDSLILIDEPEISMHPNWQMQYMSFIKKAFASIYDSHFIITTHSHFLLSDLDGETSAILALSRDDNAIKAKLLNLKNTFGWSAEEILLEVFKVPTTRNYFLNEKIGEILNLMADPLSENQNIINKIEALKELNLENLSDNDPLKEIVVKLFDKVS